MGYPCQNRLYKETKHIYWILNEIELYADFEKSEYEMTELICLQSFSRQITVCI